MAVFCGNCGALLGEQATFCGICGAKGSTPGQNSEYQALPSPTVMQPIAVSAASLAASPAKSNTLVKVVVGALAVLAVCGVLAVVGVMYAVRTVSEKAHAAARQALGDKSSATGGLAALVEGRPDDAVLMKDPCRFLSKDDVSHAVGVAILRAEPQDEGCVYIAHGDPADMTSKHMASMLTNQAKSNGQVIDAKQQQMMQQISGAFCKQQESSDKSLSAEAAKGEVVVLAVSFDTKTARMTMKVTRTAFDHVKQGAVSASDNGSAAATGTGDLAGLGDEAYEIGGTMLMVRKGNTMARFLFNECPCNADAIRPLAENVVKQL